MKIQKQSIWDWYNQNQRQLKAESVFCNFNQGKITLKYKSGFTWELRAEDFPNRNREYEQDALPGPSHKRILEGGSPHKSFAQGGAVFQGVEA
jgi:hypothetical protein